MIGDAMTKHRGNIPRKDRSTKTSDSWGQLKNDCMGVLYTNGACKPYVYSSHDLFPKDANTTIHAILATLAQQETLPTHLFLQLDNCASENKNRALFTFLAALVASGMFQTVYVNYLLVGHTHEDIDQMFSRFSIAIGKRDIFTVAELYDIYETSYTSISGHTPVVTGYHDQYDYLSWITPMLLKDLTNFPDTHVVQFTKRGEEVSCIVSIRCDCAVRYGREG